MKEESMLPATCTLDHDGCIVCSDAGIPVRVVSVEGDDALCEDAVRNQARIAIELVAPVQIGEVLLTHGGVAIGKVGDQSISRSVGQKKAERLKD